MSYQGFNYAALRPRESKSNWGDIFSNILKGYELGEKPGELKRKKEKEEFGNIIKAAEAQHAPKYYEERAKTGGLSNLYQALLNAQLQKFGDREKEAEISQKEAYGDYYNQMAQNPGGRFAPTNVEKLQNAHKRAIETYGEDSPQANQLGLALQKATTDASTRNNAIAANNLVQSIESANVDDLVRYSGPKGALKLKEEQAKDLIGKASEEYKRHKEAKKAVALEVQELRKFLGTSITKPMNDALNLMVDASNMTTDPETAKRMINKSRSVIKKQATTLQKALLSTKPYEGEKGTPQDFLEQELSRDRESESFGRQAIGEYSESDIDSTAAKYNMTREQVMQKLGLR